MLAALAEALDQLGHTVEVFTTGDSTVAVPTSFLFDRANPDRIGDSVLELRHMAAAYDRFADMDIVHDHTLAGLFHRYRPANLPIVTTCHGPFNEDLVDLYRRVADDVSVIAISLDQASRAPRDIPIAGVIPHGLDLARYRFEERAGDHFVVVGRMAAAKGIHVAIEAVRRRGERLMIAAKMREPAERRYFEEMVQPMLGDGIEYVGEADFETKVDLMSSARALLNPIQWPEPFGLVMAEAMACGTPVVAYPAGAAPEIVDDGQTGFLVSTQDELMEALDRIDDIDRAACRAAVEKRFSAERMAVDHVAVYRRLIARHRGLPVGRSIDPLDHLSARVPMSR
jgi:glycosyltransferase involved in cell wall biosynthesis